MRGDKTLIYCLLIAVATGCLLLARGSRGDPLDGAEQASRAILSLSPDLDSGRARRLGELFHDAGEESGIDPILLIAISMRESAFLPEVERLELLGRRGERGLMQVHGAALTLRPQECPASLEGAECQIRTGAFFLSFVKRLCYARCRGSKSCWVASYGMSRCARPGEADRMKSVRVVRSHWEAISDEPWERGL